MAINNCWSIRRWAEAQTSKMLAINRIHRIHLLDSQCFDVHWIRSQEKRWIPSSCSHFLSCRWWIKRWLQIKERERATDPPIRKKSARGCERKRWCHSHVPAWKVSRAHLFHLLEDTNAGNGMNRFRSIPFSGSFLSQELIWRSKELLIGKEKERERDYLPAIISQPIFS